VSAQERKGGEFGTDGTRTTTAAERYTSEAADLRCGSVQ
jgi:hypothetical protein